MKHADHEKLRSCEKCEAKVEPQNMIHYAYETPKVVRTFEDGVGIGNLLIGDALGTRGNRNGGIVAFHPGISVDSNPIRGSVASKALFGGIHAPTESNAQKVTR